jgi:sugar diacid utilization regulator
MRPESPRTTALDAASMEPLSRVIGRLPLTGELPEVLATVTEQFCALVGVRRCFLFLRDQEDGPFRGRVARSAEGAFSIDELHPSASIADAIAAAKAPLASEHAGAGEWSGRSLLGVPLLVGEDVEGLAFLDDHDRRHEFTPAEHAVALAYARLVGPIIANAKAMAALRESVVTAERQYASLTRALVADERISAFVRAGAGIREIVGAIAKVTHRECVLYHVADTHRADGRDPAALAAAQESPRPSHAQLEHALGELGRDRTSVVGPFPELGIHDRCLVAAVDLANRPSAYLVLHEGGARFRPLDRLVARRAAVSAALALADERERAIERWEAGAAVAGELLRGPRDVEALRRLARSAGVDLDAPAAIGLVAARAGHGEPLPRLRDASLGLAALLGDRRGILATAVTEGIALVVPLRAGGSSRGALSEIVEGFHAWCDSVAPAGALAVVVSTACEGVSDYPRAYADARDVAATLGELASPGRHAVVAVDELGTARMFILRPDPLTTQRFVRDTLGPLLDPADAKQRELLETLRTFLRCGRSIRACARELHLHENSVRYRLARVGELLGLDVVADSEAQLTLQMAMTVLGLSGDVRNEAESSPTA